MALRNLLGRCLAIDVCGQAHLGPVCGFLVLWLPVALETFALLHQSVFDYMCFTVNTPIRTEHILVIWSYIRIKAKVSRE